MVLARSDTKRHIISEGVASLVDRISNLPDSVLCYILSFLPTKEVVATSILSKQWTSVWTFVDKLDFEIFEASHHFAPFVYRVLKLHQGDIRALRLSLFIPSHGFFNDADVTNWINTAVDRGVVRLCLSTLYNSEYKCPLTIFSCKTLVELQLPSFDTGNINIPSDEAFFPCLKKFQVTYLTYDTESLKHFISRCPVLEHFVNSLHSPKGLEVISVDVVSSTMKRIELSSPIGINEKIHLDIPALEFLRLCCKVPPEIVIEEQLSFLVEADISFHHSICYIIDLDQLRGSFVRFIQPFASVKVLRFKFKLPEFFTSVGHAQFHNLTKLEIDSSYFEWRLLKCLMKSSVNLEDITLKKTSKPSEHKLSWKEPKNVPICLSSSLRKITIDGYTMDELPMVEYVLRTAEVLERMDLRRSIYHKDQNRWSIMLQKIQKLHRASERCKICSFE